MRALVVLSALLVVCPAAAFAETASTVQSTGAQEKPAVDGAKMLCREIPQTGTRFKKKACGRNADWKRREEESQRARMELDSGRGANTAPSQ